MSIATRSYHGPLSVLPGPATDCGSRRDRATPIDPAARCDESGDGPLERALALVEAFCEHEGTPGVSELARRCGLPKSTAHRILGILEKSRLVRRVPAGYRLGYRLYDLLNALHDCQNELREILLPYLVDTYEAARGTVQLCVLGDDMAICLERLGTSRSAPAGPRAGERIPLHCTAAGKILLAYAPESVRRQHLAGPLPSLTRSTITSPVALSTEIRRVRRDGYAVDREEHVPGRTSVAVPVWGADGSPVAALSVTGPATELQPLRVVGRIRPIAAAASQQLLRQAV